jgi:hypothetical protein
MLLVLGLLYLQKAIRDEYFPYSRDESLNHFEQMKLDDEIRRKAIAEQARIDTELRARIHENDKRVEATRALILEGKSLEWRVDQLELDLDELKTGNDESSRELHRANWVATEIGRIPLPRQRSQRRWTLKYSFLYFPCLYPAKEHQRLLLSPMTSNYTGPSATTRVFYNALRCPLDSSWSSCKFDHSDFAAIRAKPFDWIKATAGGAPLIAVGTTMLFWLLPMFVAFAVHRCALFDRCMRGIRTRYCAPRCPKGALFASGLVSMGLVAIGCVLLWTFFALLNVSVNTAVGHVQEVDAYHRGLLGRSLEMYHQLRSEADDAAYLQTNSAGVVMPDAQHENLNKSLSQISAGRDVSLQAYSSINVDLHIEQYIRDYVRYYYNNMTYPIAMAGVVLSLFLAYTIPFIVAYACPTGGGTCCVKCTRDVCGWSVWSWSFVACLLAAVLQIAGMAFSDALHDPRTSVLQFQKSDVLQYYLDCAPGGVSPMDVQFDTATDRIEDSVPRLQDFANFIQTDSPTLYTRTISLIADLNDTRTLLSETKTYLKCPTIHDLYVAALTNFDQKLVPWVMALAATLYLMVYLAPLGQLVLPFAEPKHEDEHFEGSHSDGGDGSYDSEPHGHREELRPLVDDSVVGSRHLSSSAFGI